LVVSVLYMFFIFFIWSFIFPQSEWETYYENKNIQISYTSQVCNDTRNGFAFEYYIIKVVNKTDKTFVVNFQKSKDEITKEEDKIAFVLNPNQIIEGTCEYDPVKLRIFKSENTGKDSDFEYEFALSKIVVVEVY